MKTKNYKAGRIITDMGDLLSEKSVFVENWKRISPVAFLRNWQAHRLYKWMKEGQFRYALKRGEA